MAQNSIIELQVINHIVQSKDLSFLKEENISPNQFSKTYRDIITFIYDHEREYGNVPDEGTLLSKFGEDYTVLEVKESKRYLTSKLKDFLAYVKLAEDFNEIKPLLESGDVQDALAQLRQKVDDTMKTFSPKSGATDIVHDLSRLQEYEDRISGKIEEKNYSLGFDGFDTSLGGLLSDDIVLVFARTSHGKSYLLTYIAHALYTQGLNILMYSGEMKSKDVGYRFDSINAHFSNKALMFGKHFDENKSFAQYKTYMENLKTSPNRFEIVTPLDLGGRMLNINDLEVLMERNKPDVLIIDQLSLMHDIRSNKNTQERTRYSNIMADLRLLSSTYNVPILIAAQANRKASERDEDGEFEIPEISHIAEADAIAHHCSRAIGFCTNKTDNQNMKLMKIGIRKNRFSGDEEFKVEVDFAHGYFNELKHKSLTDESGGSGF